ncbi:MAG: chromosomal replication initiator protein DnaA [Ruminococcaceae bacterium]|nr:chromosomal replication initiator protein DnaA [Oscillospiraceae bacterium]
MQFLDDLWANVIKNMRKTYAETFIELWFGDLKLEVLNDTDAVLINGSDLKCNILNERHLPTIKQYLEELLGYQVRVTILSRQNGEPDLTPYITGKVSSETPDEHSSENRADTLSKDDDDIDDNPFEQASNIFPSYHTQYTFENFIVGNSNKFAYEACIAVCNSLATQFNPLFIYGQSGLGKTHLLYAINNYVLSKNKNASIVYVKGEDFANQLIENLHRRSPLTFREKFRDKFRKTDILLIDDIQFIAGKESTQEEIFHTFNALYDAGKQIILTSDRPPKEIKTLEERLRTRFEGGLIVDIQPPDYELRSAIIKHKAKKHGVTFTPDVLDYLADNLRNNVRQIEGAVKTLAAHSFLKGAVLDVELAKKCISELVSHNEPTHVTIDRIFDKITKKYSITEEDLKGTKRNQEIARVRHICIYIIRNTTDLSLKKIGDIFSRDHATIKSSLNKIETDVKENSLLEIEINELIDEIMKK